MKFFIDTADLDNILENEYIISGVTTNPSLVKKIGKPYHDILEQIVKKTSLEHISAEVLSEEEKGMISEGLSLSKISDRIVVKLPMTIAGVKTAKFLISKGIKVNMTLCFSVTQALIAHNIKANFISPFIGRIDDIVFDGNRLIRDIRTVFDNYESDTKIISASIRSLNHIAESAISGADIATIPPKMIKDSIKHILTEKGLKIFLEDAKNLN
ncbi:MAG: putative transaldolase [Candidatus Xenolissoclinum pacificiensis L6]|uniref:Transaldolase n=1 Tax=Candidatus Xenolissoclinum pacificiensis L6 TaxID=1401685 RepID=W2V0P4_9RICK|nr:MAG: putative transaldolase [Candidatus Xenolissoclinum pacificiensis L6]